MKDIKVIGTASEMSNLIGMYAFLIECDKIKARIFITGKADNKNFICQIIEPLTGEPNLAKLMTMKELKQWVIVPTKRIADQINEDYYINGWRYSIPF